MQFLKRRVVQLRQESADLVGAGKDPAKSGVRIARVAAELRLRRFLQHHDSWRTGLLGRHRRFKGGAAAADDNYRNVFRSHGSNSPSSMTIVIDE